MPAKRDSRVRACEKGTVTFSLLGTDPGVQVTPLDSGCCGMAGMFGYERKHYEVSRAVGELRLFPALREAASGSAVVAPGFFCRHQIDHFTDCQAVSSMEILASLMGEAGTRS